MKRAISLRRLLAAFALALIAGCGFHLRGDVALPFATVFVNGGQGTPLYPELVRRLRGESSTKLVEKAEEAEAIIDISSLVFDKQILSLSGGGKVREFMLTLKLVFRVHDGKGGEWLRSSEISLRRDYSYNDSQALAKEAEERGLVQAMYADALQQMMRRLAAAKRPTAE
jgi:LPS-assembly lipoprotein